MLQLHVLLAWLIVFIQGVAWPTAPTIFTTLRITLQGFARAWSACIHAGNAPTPHSALLVYKDT